MLTVVSYDVVSDRRRTRLAEALLDFGRRVQLSVFEASLDEADFERLRGRVSELIDETEDSVRIYRLCGGCRERVDTLGCGAGVAEDPEVWVV